MPAPYMRGMAIGELVYVVMVICTIYYWIIAKGTLDVFVLLGIFLDLMMSNCFPKSMKKLPRKTRILSHAVLHNWTVLLGLLRNFCLKL